MSEGKKERKKERKIVTLLHIIVEISQKEYIQEKSHTLSHI